MTTLKWVYHLILTNKMASIALMSILILLNIVGLNHMIHADLYRERIIIHGDVETSANIYPQQLIHYSGLELTEYGYWAVFDPQFHFTPPEFQISAIRIELEQPIRDNSDIQIFFSKENQHFTEQYSVWSIIYSDERSVIIPIPLAHYSGIRVDIDVFGEFFNINNIYVLDALLTNVIEPTYTLHPILYMLILCMVIIVLWVGLMCFSGFRAFFVNTITSVINSQKVKKFINDFDSYTNSYHFFILLIIFFVIKGLFYMVYLVPLTLGVSPDDVGHLSYIQYMVHYGRRPTNQYAFLESFSLNVALRPISESVLGNIMPNYDFNYNNLNWIAKHPPAYYLIMLPFYLIVTHFTRDLALVMFVLRLVNLFMGVITFLVVYKLLNLIEANNLVKKLMLVTFVLSPMIQFYFTNLNLDGFSILITTTALYFMIRHLKYYKKIDFVLFILISAVSILTKYPNAFIIIPYVLCWFVIILWQNGIVVALKNGLSGVLLGFILVLPELMHNYRQIITLIGIGSSNEIISHRTFIDFILSNYFFDIIRRNVLSVGFHPEVWGNNVLIGIFSVLCTTIIMVYLADLVKRNIIICIVIFPMLIIFFVLKNYLLPHNLSHLSYVPFIQAFVISMILKSFIDISQMSQNKKIIHAIFITSSIFLFIFYMYGHFGSFQELGWTRATHGRYYLVAFMPFVYLFYFPLAKIRTVNGRTLNFIMIVSALMVYEVYSVHLMTMTWVL